MFMTREELRKWAESLMPGDKVIVKSGDVLRIGTVEKVTPACWVVVEKYGTYSQTKYYSTYFQRGGYKEIIPLDSELAEEAKKQEEEAQACEEKRKTILIAKTISGNWASGRAPISYGLAKKIIAMADEKEE